MKFAVIYHMARIFGEAYHEIRPVKTGSYYSLLPKESGIGYPDRKDALRGKEI